MNGQTKSRQVNAGPDDSQKNLARSETKGQADAGSQKRTSVVRPFSQEISEDRLFIEQIANTAPCCIYVIDLIKQKYVYVNDAYEKLFGCTKEQILADDGYEFVLSRVHPEDLAETMAKQEAILKELNEKPDLIQHDTIYEFEYRIKDADNQWRWFHSWGSVSKLTDDSKIQQILGIAFDVTARRQAETELANSQFRLNLLNSISKSISPDMSVEQIIEKTISAVSERFPAYRVAYSTVDPDGMLTGVQSHEPKGMPAVAGLSTDLNSAPKYLALLCANKPVVVEDIASDARLEPLLEALTAGNTKAVLDIPLKHSDKLIGLLCFDSPVPRKWSKHEIVTLTEISEYLAMAIRDSFTEHERQRVEQALRESEERFRALYEDNPSMYFTVAENGAVLSVNKYGAKQLGYKAAELVGQNVLDIFHPQDKKAVEQQLQKCLSNPETSYDWEFRKIRKSGEMIWVKEVAHAVRDKDGHLVVLIVCEDITEKKKLQEQLQHSQRLEAAGRVAGQIAHDFNNLLAPLTAYPALIREDLKHGRPVSQLIDEMETAAKQIAEINQQLLALGRRGHYTMEPIDIDALIEKVLFSIRLPQGLKVKTEMPPGLFAVKGGAAQLSRALTNLILNATEATQGAGTLTIKAQNIYLDTPLKGYQTVQPGEYVQLDISDDGPGIAEHIVGKIFEPFFSTKIMDRMRGSGLGLSIVHGVIEDHRGYITLETETGRGTTFSLYLPITRESSLKENDRIFETASGNERILIVDDDPMQRKVVSQLLKRLGYKVHALASGSEAVAHLREASYDLVILDMIMDGFDGAETYRQILGIRPEQKAIVVSGYATSPRVEEALRLGASAFIAKPVQFDNLALAVRTSLDKD